MKFFIGFFLLLITNFVIAEPVPFNMVKEFHQDRVSVIKRNYGLENDLDISILIVPKEMKTLNAFRSNRKIKLPGILLGGIEAERNPATIGMYEIISDLKNYKREVTVIKKRTVSDEEVQALILSLKEHLSLRPDEIVRVEDRTFKFDQAMKNWKSDFKESLYQGTFKSSIWAWVPITLIVIGFISLLFSWALKSGFKTLGRSIEKVDLKGDSQERGGLDNQKDLNYSSEFEEALSSNEAETVYEADPKRAYQKFVSLFNKSKYELYKILWTSLPTQGLQISFFEMISQSLDEEEERAFKKIYFEAFKLDNGSLFSSSKIEKISPNIMAKINKSVSMAEMSEPVLIRERALAAIYPKFGKTVKSIVENSIESFFEVTFYLFPELVVNLVKEKPSLSDVVSRKLPAFLSKPSSERMPSSQNIQEFAEHVETNQGFVKDDVATDIGEHAMSLLSIMPDSEIFGSQFQNLGGFKSLKKIIPSVDWITDANLQTLRRFLIQLSVEEIGYLKREHFDFNGLIANLDERALMRVNESVNRSQRNTKPVNILLLRKKIAGSFKPKDENLENLGDEFYDAA